MSRSTRFLLLALQFVVAGASIANIVSFRLSHLMDPRISDTDAMIAVAVGAIMLLTIVTGFACWRGRWRPGAAKLAGVGAILVLTVLAGFTPQYVTERRDTIERAARAEQGRHQEEAYARDFARWTARIDMVGATQRAFDGEEAWAFFNFVVGSDLSYSGLEDHWQEAFALLQKALVAKLLDPNVLVQGVRSRDTSPRPLFLQFYVENFAPGRRAYAIRGRDWEIMQVLAANGADLARADAAELVGDLAKTVVPGPGRFITLK